MDTVWRQAGENDFVWQESESEKYGQGDGKREEEKCSMILRRGRCSDVLKRRLEKRTKKRGNVG